MNNKKRLLVLTGIVAIALTTAIHAAPEKSDKPKDKTKSSQAVTSPAPEKKSLGSLKAERSGEQVTVTWKLDEKWDRVEVLRNDKSDSKGRSRVKTYSSSTTTFTDTLPDGGKQYWYWLKLSTKDGKTGGVGPIKAE